MIAASSASVSARCAGEPGEQRRRAWPPRRRGRGGPSGGRAARSPAPSPLPSCAWRIASTEVSVLGVPAGGEPVQPRDLVRRLAAQLEPQQVGEQVVVAEPGARHVHRDDERVGLLELVQQPRPVAASGQEVGERAVDALEDAGAQQQVPHLGRLAAQHLAQQVVGDGPLAARELGHEPVRSVVAGERHRGQPQAGGPALRALVQPGQVARGDARRPPPASSSPASVGG